MGWWNTYFQNTFEKSVVVVFFSTINIVFELAKQTAKTPTKFLTGTIT